MRRLSLVPILMMSLCLGVNAAQAIPIWTAYNDFAGPKSTGNVTNISRDPADRPAGAAIGPSGTLVKFLDNSSTGVLLTITGLVDNWNFLPLQGNYSAGATDVNTYFGSPGSTVSPLGMTDHGTHANHTITLTFTGLDVNGSYSFTLFANREADPDSPGNTRWMRGQIQDIDSFSNASSSGAKVIRKTQAMFEDTTAVNIINTRATGEVTRYTNIRPGSDGDMIVFLDSPIDGVTIPLGNFSNWTEINLMRLDLDAIVPEPSTYALALLGLVGLACVALRKKFRRA